MDDELLSNLPIIAIVISAFSLLVAALALGWNIYRDIILKPKLEVSVAISVIAPDHLPAMTLINISGVNHGPEELNCRMIVFKVSSIWKRLLKNVTHGVVMADETNPYSSHLPIRLEVGQDFNLLIPYDEKCGLSEQPTHIGIVDSFGRNHWAPKERVRTANKNYVDKFVNPKET